MLSDRVVELPITSRAGIPALLVMPDHLAGWEA